MNNSPRGNELKTIKGEAYFNFGNRAATAENPNAACKIGNVAYMTLDEAFDNVKDGDTITLLSDITKRGAFGCQLGQISVTIDGNNHKITNTWCDSERKIGEKNSCGYGLAISTCDYTTPLRPKVTIKNLIAQAVYKAFYASDTCDVTLINCTSVQTAANSQFKHHRSSVSASFLSALTVESGEYTENRLYAVYAHGTGAKIRIKNGNFAGKIQADPPESERLVVQIEISGGTFTNCSFEKAVGAEIIVKGGTFDCDPSDYLAFGYTATESKGVWTVTKTWFAENFLLNKRVNL